MFNLLHRPLFFLPYFSPLLRATIGMTHSASHYHNSLDHNDKTWKHGAVPPLVRHEIMDGCTAVVPKRRRKPNSQPTGDALFI
jgi:hypothetical protein